MLIQMMPNSQSITGLHILSLKTALAPHHAADAALHIHIPHKFHIKRSKPVWKNLLPPQVNNANNRFFMKEDFGIWNELPNTLTDCLFNVLENIDVTVIKNQAQIVAIALPAADLKALRHNLRILRNA